MMALTLRDVAFAMLLTLAALHMADKVAAGITAVQSGEIVP